MLSSNNRNKKYFILNKVITKLTKTNLLLLDFKLFVIHKTFISTCSENRPRDKMYSQAGMTSIY